MRLILPIAVALCAGCGPHTPQQNPRSEEHTSELQSQSNIVCRLLLEKKKQQAVDWRAFVLEGTFATTDCHPPPISEIDLHVVVLAPGDVSSRPVVTVARSPVPHHISL